MEGTPSKACRLLFLEPNRGGEGESLFLAIQFFKLKHSDGAQRLAPLLIGVSEGD